MPSPIMEFFEAGHLPPLLKDVSEECGVLATYMENRLEDDPEKSTGLRKLLEAKDCFVRSAIRQEKKRRAEQERAQEGGV